jgi:hypothetical protein
MPRILLLLLLSGALAVGAPGPVTVRDVEGRAWAPLTVAPGEVHLLFFVSSECPVSNRYAPEIDRIAEAFLTKHVHSFLIYATPSIDPSSVRASVKEFHAKTASPAIIDTDLTLTTTTGVTVTPEVAVLTHGGTAYRGRIDDLYVNAGQTRRTAQHHDLRDALDAVLAGRPVAQSNTPAVGCFIESKTP